MFKRVKTIGLLSVGLLAMLATKADAHYMYVSGNYYYHSVGCQATIGSLPNPPDPLAVGCVVNTVQVETLCPDLSIVSLPIQANLVAQVKIPPGQTEVEVIVSDNPLLNPGLNNACGTLSPIAVLIRNMASTITVFRCVGLVVDPCLVRLPTSTATALCELPAQFNFDNYPENLPPDGTPFTCTDPVIVHVN